MAKVYTSQSWWQFPMIRITLALIIGILLGKYLLVPYGLIGTVFTASSLLWLFNRRGSLFVFLKRRWITGLSVLLLFIYRGILLYKKSIPSDMQLSYTVILLESAI